ncbi:MAG: SRPBCC family protein [Candidatus Zixiibacteriota bacterium]
MKTYIFERKTLIPQPPERVFPFFERPENLAEITPPSMGFEILTPPPVPMQIGTVIDYTVRALGVRLHWRTLITDYRPPYNFVDVQLKGPYKFWHHTHRFERHPEGTLMYDRVVYALPFGWLGRLIHALAVRRQLSAIFEFREKVIKNQNVQLKGSGII